MQRGIHDSLDRLRPALFAIVLAASLASARGAPTAIPEANRAAAVLRAADIWMLPQPKEADLRFGRFDLRRCGGIRLAGAAGRALPGLPAQLAVLLRARSGVAISTNSTAVSAASLIRIGLFPDGRPRGLSGISGADLRGLGEQGYAIDISPRGIDVAALGAAGLRFGVRALAQIACDRTTVPGVHIRDWPSLRYRGLCQDISRGQVPTPATLKRLADVLAEGRMNLLELYIENEFRSPRHPGFAPPEALTSSEGRDLFNAAARIGVEVHPMLQVLGHSGLIVNLPAFQQFRVRDNKPWLATYDIRKPETVAFVGDLVDEVCATFPGRFLEIDITEVDVDGFAATGMKSEELPQLILGYLLKLRERAKAHGVRLIIAQGPLDSTGSLSGMGPVLDQMPRDIAIASFYTTMIYSGWDKDFPRLRELGFDFFAQPWIDSHIRIIPDIAHAARFSESEVSKGVQSGAIGSVTSDWGDDGHFHLVGHTWLPVLYHGAVAWNGAAPERTYFDRAFCRVLYGLGDDGAARAVRLLGDIDEQKVKVRDAKGVVTETESPHYWEFWQDPFSHPDLTRLADPAGMSRDVLGPADQAARLLERARADASRNRDNLDQILFAARCYQAMGHKLQALADFRDPAYPRPRVAAELRKLVDDYEALRVDFRRLWLAEDRDNSGYRELVDRFNNTIVPCRARAAELAR